VHALETMTMVRFHVHFLRAVSRIFSENLVDFGLDVLEEHVKNSNFTWLISNVLNEETKKPLGNVSEKHIIEINDLKVGTFFLC
jgi:hypothetical protein